MPYTLFLGFRVMTKKPVTSDSISTGWLRAKTVQIGLTPELALFYLLGARVPQADVPRDHLDRSALEAFGSLNVPSVRANARDTCGPSKGLTFLSTCPNSSSVSSQSSTS